MGCIPQPATDQAGDPGGKGDVWGEDDRKERYEIESAPLQAAARSSVAMLRNSRMQYDRARNVWSASMPRTLRESQNVCDGERFVDQPTIAACAGTLIGDDLVLTAGHCFENTSCAEMMVVFDYAYETSPMDPMLAASDIPADNVYRCGEIITSQFAVDFMNETGPDVAVFRLSRKVVGHSPARVNWSEPVESGKPAYVIGHPTGLPQKLSTGVILDATTNPEYIVHDADVFGGNSGGGLFDANGTLIGIHVRSSAQRYIPAEDGRSCTVAAVCEETASCPRKPHAYDPRALAKLLSPDQRMQLGIPTTGM